MVESRTVTTVGAVAQLLVVALEVPEPPQVEVSVPPKDFHQVWLLSCSILYLTTEVVELLLE
jgi:hypothetical protein